jgi:hypothetical protein
VKPLRANQKKPRGAAVDPKRDADQRWAIKLCHDAMSATSSLADTLFKLDPKIAISARKIRAELGALESRIENLDVLNRG